MGGVLCYLREQRCSTTTHPRRITPIYQHLHDTDFLSIVLDGGVVHVNAIGLSRDELLLVAEGISEGDRPKHVEVGSPAGFEWLED